MDDTSGSTDQDKLVNKLRERGIMFVLPKIGNFESLKLH